MEIVNKNIDEIIPYENNPRDNEKAVDYVLKSIKQFGFKVPIIIDKNNIIVTGHTRLKAAQKLGLKEVPVIMADDLTEEQIKAFRLADNKVSEYSIWDNKLLLEELESIGSGIFTGFDISELFDDILDEKDNSLLEENEAGVEYIITIKTQDKEKIEKIQSFLESVDFYE